MGAKVLSVSEKREGGGFEQLERAVYRSFLPSTAVKSEWTYTTLSPIWYHGINKDYVTFTFTHVVTLPRY